MLKLKLTFYSAYPKLIKNKLFFYKKYLNFFVLKFLHSNTFFCLKPINITSLPKPVILSSIKPRISPVTVLRSPHVFKKSKEKFISKLYKYLITLNLFYFNLNFFFLLKYIITYFFNSSEPIFKLKITFCIKKFIKL